MPSDIRRTRAIWNVFVVALAVLLTVICANSIASAQTGWSRTYGGADVDVGNCATPTVDGGYIVTGCTESFGAGRQDVYYVKTDASGDTLWTRTYGGADDDAGNCIEQTADGGFIITGYTYSFGQDDLLLIKTNATGDTSWTKVYGGQSTEGWSVQQTTDGGYVVAGYTYSVPGNGDVYLLKTSASGDTLWSRTYGGTENDCGNSILQTSDGGYILAGFTRSFGAGNEDLYLIKTNAQGETLWTRTYGGVEGDAGNYVRQTADGGYLVTGYSYSFGAGNGDVYLIKTDSLGDSLWTRLYGGTANDMGYCGLPTSDGGYIIAGSTSSFGAGYDDLYLIKTNGEGDTLWTRAFGGPSYDVGYSCRPTSDGGCITTGYTRSFGAGNADVYLIKTDSLGNAGTAEPLATHPAKPTRYTVQPNPITSVARVHGHEAELFALADVAGRQVTVCRGDRIGAGLRPGIYFLSPAGLRTGKAVTIIKAGD